MRTLGIAPRDAVLLIERRDNGQVVRNALIVSLSMDEKLAGAHGEPSIAVAFVNEYEDVMTFEGVVHLSHADWREGRAGLAYEELPYPAPGVCRFCRCTERRACPEGCAWIDVLATVCSAPECIERYNGELQELDGHLGALPPEDLAAMMGDWWADAASQRIAKGDTDGGTEALRHAVHFSALAKLKREGAAG